MRAVFIALPRCVLSLLPFAVFCLVNRPGVIED